MTDSFVQTRRVSLCLAVAAIALGAVAQPARAQDDATFLRELQKQGFRDIAAQFARDHAGVGTVAAGRDKLDLLQAELNDPNTSPTRRGEVATEAIALAREMLKVEPPRGATPGAAKEQLAHANLRVVLGGMLLGQAHGPFQNGILVGLGREDLKRFLEKAEEALKALAPAADTITKVIEVMENDDEFDKNWGEDLYLKTLAQKNIARYLTARAKLYVAWALPKAVPRKLDADAAAPIQKQVDRRIKLLEEADKEMEYWTRQPARSGVKFESLYLRGVIKWQQGKAAMAEALLKAAMVAEAPVVVRFMAKAAMIRSLLEDKQYAAALQAATAAIQWAAQQRKALGPNAEVMLLLLKSDVILSQASDARRRGEMADYKRLKKQALADLTKYAVEKPELKAALYQKYVQRLLEDARAAGAAPKPPELLKPEDPATPPATQPEDPAAPPTTEPPAQPAEPTALPLEDPEVDILPTPKTLEPFELAALGAVLIGEKRYAGARYYLEALVEREKEEAAKPFINEGLFNLGVALYSLGEDVPAADPFVRLAARDIDYPLNFDGLEYAIKIYVNLLSNDATQASVRVKLEHALALTEKLPDSPKKRTLLDEWRFTRGDNLRHLEKFIEAARQFEKVPATDPQYYEARYDIVRSYYNYVERLKQQKAIGRMMRSACTDAIDRAKKYLLYADAEIAKLKGTPAAKEIVPGSKTGLTVLNSRINDKGQVELWIVDLLVNLTPPGAGETKEDLLRKAVPMLEKFPDKYPDKPQRELVAQALGMLAEVWLTLGDLERAVQVVENFKKRYPKEASELIRLILDALLNEVERLRKAGLTDQAKSKATVAVRLVESQIDWVRKFETDPAKKRKGLYDLMQLAASLYREAEQREKAIEYYGRLIIDRQRQMVEHMVKFIRANCTDEPGKELLKDVVRNQKKDFAEAKKLEGEAKWHQAAGVIENLRDNLWQWTNRYFVARNEKLPAEFTAVSDDATNYKGMAQTYMELKNYKEAKRRWWKLHNTLRGPDRPGGDVKEKQQWWESLYYGVQCDLLQERKSACQLHKLRLEIFLKNYPDMGGPEWKPKFLELLREITKFIAN